MAFWEFLYCLNKVGAFKQSDYADLALKGNFSKNTTLKMKALVITHAVRSSITVFQSYMLLMREVQQTYLLEPAGSKGVWSLDGKEGCSLIFF